MGVARLAAADERISRALADAVERHAAKDPGVRGILKRASATCHPESESQKKIALDTEQESTPRPSVSSSGSSASGTRPSTATRTAQDADTSDVTRGTGPELAQGVIQPSSTDDNGDDVGMEGENAGERSAGDSNPSGPDSRRRITTKREPREARDEQPTVTGQHVPRRMSRKTTPPCKTCTHVSYQQILNLTLSFNTSFGWNLTNVATLEYLTLTVFCFHVERVRGRNKEWSLKSWSRSHNKPLMS